MLELSPQLMIITAVIFLGLIIYLNKSLYEPVISFVEQRDASIAKDLATAKELDDESDTILQKANEILENAKKEANSIRQNAINSAKAESEALIESKQKELDESYGQFLAKLEEEKKELENGLKAQIPLIKESIKAKFAQI